MAFIDELKALAEKVKAKAGDDAAKVEGVIKACNDGTLVEMIQSGSSCSAAGGLIRVHIDEIKQGQQAAVCTIILTNARRAAAPDQA